MENKKQNDPPTLKLRQDTEIPGHPLRFILFSSKPYKKWAIIAPIMVVIAASMGAFMAYIFRQVVDSATLFSQNNLDNVYIVLWWALTYAGFELVRSLIYRISGFCGAKWITGIEAHGYKKLFDYMSKHSQSFFDNRFAGALVNDIFNATRSSAGIVEAALWNYLSTIIRFITAFILVYFVNIWIALIFAFWIILLIPINYKLAKKRKIYSEKEAALSSELRGKSVDTTSNISAVRQYAQRGWEVNRLNKVITSYRDSGLKGWHFGETMLLINNIILGFFTFSTLTLTFYFWQNGALSLGVFVMVMTLVIDMIDHLTFIGHSMNRFAKDYGETQKGLTNILYPHEIKDKEDAKNIIVKNGEINIEKMSFNYGEGAKSVMSNFNLNIPAGQRIGIVGTSGAGKTTLIKLLLRQHEVDKGSISIDNQNINDITLDSLRKNIGIVPQEPLLFHRSIKENIRYGKLNATNEEVEKAAKLAQAHDFIKKLPQGYDTLVGERGVKLSAGQKQRVAISRAILKDAPILILDEATSALDSESEVLIQKALEELMKNKTVLAVAHRLSTLSEMDRIIVMKQGKIVEDGSHQELLENKDGMYSMLWNHQAGGFLQEE